MSVNLKAGSRWLLPVTFYAFSTAPEHFPETYANVAVKGVRWVSIPPSEIAALIPADRITELEAEVARLREEILGERDWFPARSEKEAG